MNYTKSCYCAFCRVSRKVFRKKHLGILDFLLCIFASTLLGLLVWEEFSPKVLVIVPLFMVLGEIFVQVRWRLSLACPQCGFDPLVYIRDPQRACELVKKRLEKRKADPIEKWQSLPIERLRPNKKVKGRSASIIQRPKSNPPETVSS